MDNLHQAATRADDYALTHRGSFSRPNSRSLDATNKVPREIRYDHGSGTNPQNTRDKNDPQQNGSVRIPPGPTCYYCKWRGHIKAACPALAKRNSTNHSNAVVASQRQKDANTDHEVMEQEKMPDEYRPFVSQGTVSLMGCVEASPVTIY